MGVFNPIGSWKWGIQKVFAYEQGSLSPLSYSVASKHGRFNTYGLKNGYSSSSIKQVISGPIRKFKGSVNPLGVEEREDDLLNGKLEKTMVPYEKLEKLLFDKMYRCENPKNINRILTNVIILSLSSNNPAKVVQDKLTYYNRLYWTNKMISCVENSMNVDPLTTFVCLVEEHVLDEGKQNYVWKLSGHRH